MRANRSRSRRHGGLGRFMFKPLCKQLFLCPWTGPLTFLCCSDLFVNLKCFLLNLGLLMPVDFFDVTSAGVAHILRLRGLQEELDMYNWLAYILYVLVQHLAQCNPDATMWAFQGLPKHTSWLVKYDAVTFPVTLYFSFILAGILKYVLFSSTCLCTCVHAQEASWWVSRKLLASWEDRK